MNFLSLNKKTMLFKIFILLLFFSFVQDLNAEDEKNQFLEKAQTKNGVEIRGAFQSVIKQALKSSFKIEHDGKELAYGVVIDSKGLAITKSSEIDDEMTCTFLDGHTTKATVVHRDKKQDLAMIQLEEGPFEPVKWSESSLDIGQWVVIPGIENRPVSIGIVSGGSRRIPAERGVFGVSLNSSDSQLVITKVFPGTGASQAKIKKDDILVSIDGQLINSKNDFRKSLQSLKAGDSVKVKLKRNSEEITVRVVIGYPTGNFFSRMNFQNQMGGFLSTRRSGFSSVFSHDALLKANQCGGVLVNLEGEAIGINIARAGRTDTFSLPAKIVLEIIKNYKSTQK
jgi:serine protease Do